MTAHAPRALTRPARAARLALLVFAAALIAGCALSRPAPLKNIFLLEASAPPAAVRTHPATLRVGAFNVAAAYRGRAFVYRDSELEYATDYYREFLVAPAAMVGEATAWALARAGVFASVVPPGATPDGDYLLNGFVSELYGDARSRAAPIAVLSVTFYLSAPNAPVPALIWTREYRQRVPASGTSPEALGRAWNAALSTVVAELARDLAAADLPKP